MTRNQIEYVKLLETKRSNLRNEELTSARDTAAREAKLVELKEAARHNLATESLTGRDLDIRQASLDETARHNTVTERQTYAAQEEQRRHNTATERATLIDLNERQRHNVVTEAETAQHNRTTEAETSTHNRNVENEAHRHNLVGEVTDAGRLTLDTVTREQQIAETKRHNLAMESKDMSPDVHVTTTVEGSTSSAKASGNGSTTTPQKASVVELDPERFTSADIGHYRMINGVLHYVYQRTPNVGAAAPVYERAGANYYNDHHGMPHKIG